MAQVKAFKALRPFKNYAPTLISKPYDVVNGDEIKAEAKKNPLTFFKVTRAELEFDKSENPYSQKIYLKAKENLEKFIANKNVFQEESDCFYIYELNMNGNKQTGIVGLSAVEDYDKNIIKKHELTRPDKENDRINHMFTIKAQTGNVFLAYKNITELDALIEECKKKYAVEYDVTPDDSVNHKIWVVNKNEDIKQIENIFKNKVDFTYIADGHHRAASAAKIRLKLNNPKTQYFLTTLFPANQLKIFDYNRIIKDLNNLDIETFLNKIKENFNVEQMTTVPQLNQATEFGMYLNGLWYKITFKGKNNTNVIKSLSVSILQDYILDPILNIDDPRTNQKIDFVGGIKGWQELVRQVDSKKFVVAFMIYPITMNELFAVADANQIMPPKSTWFEPKLRDGFFTHLL